MEDCLKVVSVEFSTLSLAVLLNGVSAQHKHGHFQSRKLGAGFVLLAEASYIQKMNTYNTKEHFILNFT